MDNPNPPQGRSVLCIEDEHFISELYNRALTRGGYNVKVVVDGKDGLAEALTDKYDIILLDIMVPNMMGTDILKELRPEGVPKIRAKIIITTNLEQDEHGRAAIENLADGYVIKAEMTPRQIVGFLDQLAT